MLVMLDAIHERFHDVDATTAWARLTDADNPPIWFLLLPLSGLGSDAGEDMRPEDLYIKMNSRGKPLTEFENFKAHFEKTIQWSPRSAEFALKVDTTWSDLLWGLRGDDDLIDDEFLRYMEFITEVCEWREGRTDGAGQHLGPRTRKVFGIENPQREAHLEFLFDALDIWVDRSIPETFESIFTSIAEPESDGVKVRLFFRPDGTEQDPLNLFEACCRSYGETRGRNRVFSLGQTLMLYAVLLHLIEGTDEFPRRVRVLRNLIEASSDELRLDRMPKILQDVHRVIRDGDVGLGRRAQPGTGRGREAQSRLPGAPRRAEDRRVPARGPRAAPRQPRSVRARPVRLREPSSPSSIASWQHPDLWPDLLGALLAVGEYQRQRTNARPFLFGTDSKRHDNAWRELLTGATRDSLGSTRQVLGAFLDRIAASPTDAERNPDGDHERLPRPVRGGAALRLAVLHGQVPSHARERLEHLLRRARRGQRARCDGLLALHAACRWSRTQRLLPGSLPAGDLAAA